MSKKPELIKKLESRVCMVRICDEYEVKKQTGSDMYKAKDKLTPFAMKYDVDAASTARERKHMKVPKDKELEEAVYKWFVQQRSCGVKVRYVKIV
ncbi:Tigger transposable element-derived protein 7-like 76 [Homarus americanus]|uniref:Tigger transposable element-derived protein 7-like 76 n=1 Tax=Homarus americanus TaxID=6706 RepID=A0A8J5MYE1_HOMAM|nr:Tigger transposable element-derived protein 7-like 76 [Homarus americanus]